MQLEVYVMKDFTKNTDLKYLHNFKRKWSTSRGITPSKEAPKFELKTISHYGGAIKLFEATKENYIDYYKNDMANPYEHYKKMLFNLKLGYAQFKTRIPTRT